MIKEGELTIIDSNTYSCVKIEDGVAHLRDVSVETGGRNKLVKVAECPYVENGKLIVPEKIEPPKYKGKTKVNLTRLLKEITPLTVSTKAKWFLAEWVETAVANLVANAEESAKSLGHRRITEAHLYWLETNEIPVGHWPSNLEYLKEE